MRFCRGRCVRRCRGPQSARLWTSWLLRLERLSQQLSEKGVFCGRDGPQVEQDAALVDAHDDRRIEVAHICREHCF